MEIEDLIAEDDQVVAWARMTGTQTGSLGPVPASGGRVDFRHAQRFRLRDGRIVEHWAVRDDLRAMVQAGVITPLSDQRADESVPGTVGLGDELTIRASAIIGMVASALWIVALVVEYRFSLRPPGDGSGPYLVDQAAFALAELGYLILLIGLFRSRAGGDGTFGRLSIGIWAIAIAALVIAQFLGLIGAVVILLLPVGGLGQLIGSILTAIAVWRARRWMGWRRWAPAIWALYTLILFVAIATAIPGLANPARAPYPTSPSELAEAGWQVTWFLVGIALYIESGRLTHLPTSRCRPA